MLTALRTATPSPSPSPTPSPSPSPTLPSIDDIVERARQAAERVETQPPPCGRDDFSVCGVALRLTGSDRTASVLGWLLSTPLRIAFLVVAALVVRRVLHRIITRIADRAAAGPPMGPGAQQGAARFGTSPLLVTRREQRAHTLAQVLRSLTTGVVGALIVLMILSELGFDVAPLLASAGVLGVALGFGAQQLVRDFLSGVFIIIEDQYGVGDVVDVGPASGTIEAVNLRVTRIRDVNGTVWYVRNGEILRVGNKSQGWSRTVLDIAVGYDRDIGTVQEALLDVARELREDEVFGARVLADPEVWGVEALTKEGVVLRLVVKTQPLQQWTVARELRRRIKERFERDGIPLPAPDVAAPLHEDDPAAEGHRT